MKKESLLKKSLGVRKGIFEKISKECNVYTLKDFLKLFGLRKIIIKTKCDYDYDQENNTIKICTVEDQQKMIVSVSCFPAHEMDYQSIGDTFFKIAKKEKLFMN